MRSYDCGNQRVDGVGRLQFDFHTGSQWDRLLVRALVPRPVTGAELRDAARADAIIFELTQRALWSS